MESLLKKIWRYNKVTAGWVLVRDTYPENENAWLRILRGDQPGEFFEAHRKRPTHIPEALVLKAHTLEQARYVQRSGFSVTTSRAHGTVSIESSNGETAWFLQGHEGEEFLEQAQDLYEQAAHVSMQDVEYSLAKSYIDSL